MRSCYRVVLWCLKLRPVERVNSRKRRLPRHLAEARRPSTIARPHDHAIILWYHNSIAPQCDLTQSFAMKGRICPGSDRRPFLEALRQDTKACPSSSNTERRRVAASAKTSSPPYLRRWCRSSLGGTIATPQASKLCPAIPLKRNQDIHAISIACEPFNRPSSRYKCSVLDTPHTKCEKIIAVKRPVPDLVGKPGRPLGELQQWLAFSI